MPKYPVDRKRDLSGPTELRIHGVGGTPPENLLGDDAVLVAGSELSGFYRLTKEKLYVPPDPSTNQDASMTRDRRRASLEAYSWGGLTSGGAFLRAVAKSFWVFLLPQALVNTAGWMLPPVAGADDPSPGKGSLRHRTLRLIGLWTTIVFALAVAVLTTDLLMLQCGGNENCVASHSWLKWLGWSGLGTPMDYPGRLVVLGLMAPGVALFVMWLIARTSQRTSEGVELTDQDLAKASKTAATDKADSGYVAETGESSTDAALARHDLWNSPNRVGSLTRIHLAAAVASVGVVAAASLWWLEDATGDSGVVFLVLGGLAALVAIVAVILTIPDGARYDQIHLERALVTKGQGANIPTSRRLTWGLLAIAVMLVVVLAVVGWIESPLWGDVDAFELGGRYTWWALLIGIMPILALMAAFGLMLLVARWDRARADYTRIGAWGAVSVGLIIGAAFIIGGALWLADWLDRFPEEAEACDACALPYEIVLRDAYTAGAVALLFIMAVVVALGLSGLVRLWFAKKKHLPKEELWDDLVTYGAVEKARLRFPWLYRNQSNAQMKEHWEAHKRFTAWLRGIRSDRIIAANVRGRVALGALVGALFATGFGVWAAYDIGSRAFSASGGFESILSGSWAAPVATVAKWILLAVFTRLLYVVIRSYRDPDYRRGLAKIWDVLTFWPRWFQPFAPPSYVGVAVPQLRDHLRAHHGGPKDRVVIAAHSQGAILALATVARLERDARKGVALLTFGNPARQLYGWFFPSFFGRTELDKLAEALDEQPGPPRWRNLARCTDPIGGAPLFTGTFGCVVEGYAGTRMPDGERRLNDIDRVMPDPFPMWPVLGDPMPAPKGHSGYDEDPPYATAVCDLFDQLGVAHGDVGCPGTVGASPPNP